MNKKITATSSILSVISLLADILALSQIAYSVIVQKEADNVVIRLIIIALVFLLGLGLGNIGLKGTEAKYLEQILVLYTWGYLIVACLSYLGVIIQLRGAYSFTDYISFITILIIQLSAFTVLLLVTKVETMVSYSIAILTLAVLHALVFLYYFIFSDLPSLDKVAAELAIWLGWTLYAAYIIYKSNRTFGFKKGFKK